MVKFHPTSQHTVSWYLPDSSSSITCVWISCHLPSMAHCRLFSATVQDSVCGYNNDKLLLLRSSKVAPVSQKHMLVSRKHLKVIIEICISMTVGFIDH